MKIFKIEVENFRLLRSFSMDLENELSLVSCTRAKENLAVFYHNPKPEVIAKAKEWFGLGSIFDLENI